MHKKHTNFIWQAVAIWRSAFKYAFIRGFAALTTLPQIFYQTKFLSNLAWVIEYQLFWHETIHLQVLSDQDVHRYCRIFWWVKRCVGQLKFLLHKDFSKQFLTWFVIESKRAYQTHTFLPKVRHLFFAEALWQSLMRWRNISEIFSGANWMSHIDSYRFSSCSSCSINFSRSAKDSSFLFRMCNKYRRILCEWALEKAIVSRTDQSQLFK